MSTKPINDATTLPMDDLTKRINDLLCRKNIIGISAQEIAEEVRKEIPEVIDVLAYHVGDGGREWYGVSSWVRINQCIALVEWKKK